MDKGATLLSQSAFDCAHRSPSRVRPTHPCWRALKVSRNILPCQHRAMSRAKPATDFNSGILTAPIVSPAAPSHFQLEAAVLRFPVLTEGEMIAYAARWSRPLEMSARGQNGDREKCETSPSSSDCGHTGAFRASSARGQQFGSARSAMQRVSLQKSRDVSRQKPAARAIRDQDRSPFRFLPDPADAQQSREKSLRARGRFPRAGPAPATASGELVQDEFGSDRGPRQPSLDASPQSFGGEIGCRVRGNPGDRRW